MLLRIPALLIAITFHEYAHAKASDALGDPTPVGLEMSLNPMAHLDPIGLECCGFLNSAGQNLFK